MPAHQARGDFQVLLLRGFPSPDDAFDPAGISREIFFHENVDAYLDRVFQMRRAKRRVGREHGDVARTQAIDGMPISVKPEEPAILGHIDAVAQGLAESLWA